MVSFPELEKLQSELLSHIEAAKDLAALEQELSDALGTTVAIRPGPKGSGQLVVRYGSLEHLDTLLAKLRA